MENIKIFLIVFITVSYSYFACSEAVDNITEPEYRISKKSVKKFTDSLIFLNETETVFKTPESVKYSEKDSIFYVSNVNGNPAEKKGNGFISKLNFNREITDIKWITGLNAPKGMGIFKEKLYVADIDELVEISIYGGKIINKFAAEGAKFLNDIDIDKSGNVYVSDTQTGDIWILHENNFELWLQSDLIVNPNGLYCKGDFLLIGAKNSILSVNYKSKRIKTFIDNTGSIDGLEETGSGKFVFSDWSGCIFISGTKGEKKLLLNTVNEKINAADLEYIKSDRLLAVPTFFHNTVSFYRLAE